jgi:Xaa-Pro dipeptidase
MQEPVPFRELEERMRRFIDVMDEENPSWETACIFGKLNQYYFTGTMQDGMLFIPRTGNPVYFVRRSFERAKNESVFSDIRPMKSFRDAAHETGACSGTVYLEMERVPLALFSRFKKYFPFQDARPLDLQVSKVRAVKSDYELSLLGLAGKQHRYVLEDLIPGMLREGVSEADFGAELYAVMVRHGHHGIVRFGMFDTEIVIGQLGFGESSIYPTYFDGPGGAYGMGPAVPVLGSRDRLLSSGDLVFVDNAFGTGGYHTDKTMTFMFGSPLPDHAIDAHYRCVEIQDEIASMLRPGARPSEIYSSIMDTLDEDFLNNFMGYGDRKVQFLGHGVGLQVDELPVLSRGFDEPLQEGMVFAVEPKKGIEKVGMVGIENTYIVRPGGGKCITGDSKGLVPVY